MPGYEIYNTVYTTNDVTSMGGVNEFNFTQAPKQIWVLCVGGDGKATVNEGTPSGSNGVPCLDGVPTPIPVAAQKVSVYADAAVVISVWGFG